MSTKLETSFGGLHLSSPLIVSACPMMAKESMREEVAHAGAGALVLPSLFQEEIVKWNQSQGVELTEFERQLLSSPSVFDEHEPAYSVEHYLTLVNRACTNSSIPVIASLNGEVQGNWIEFAAELQETNAAAVELNFYHRMAGSLETSTQIEDRLVELVRAIDAVLSVPLIVKLSPHWTSISHLARRLLSGVQGIVLFGRAPDQDIQIESMSITSKWTLTSPGDIVHSLASISQAHQECPVMPIAANGGIDNVNDFVRAILSGADVVMITSALYRHGPAVITRLLTELDEYLDRHELSHFTDLYDRRPLRANPAQLRADYKRMLSGVPERT
jgi:dihydroorotate dehydrogenase (fumarate)